MPAVEPLTRRRARITGGFFAALVLLGLCVSLGCSEDKPPTASTGPAGLDPRQRMPK